MAGPVPVSFFDLSPGLVGWCAGTGEVRPVCSAFRLDDHGDDLGAMGVQFSDRLERHITDYQPRLIGYESPLLVRHDTLLKLRRTYGLGVLLETIATRHGIPTFERDPKTLKGALTGNAYASKADMVEAALLAGINLPSHKSEGKEDAADAFAGWFLGLREVNKRQAAAWDRIIHSKGRGGLI